jgi:hypothetical protein
MVSAELDSGSTQHTTTVTLILSHLSRTFVLQVTDRLVVAKRNDNILHPFDALANKNLIYLARDAIVSIGVPPQLEMEKAFVR